MAVHRTSCTVLEDGFRQCEYMGKSTDTKPVEIGMATGSMFIEVDTNDAYWYDEEGDPGSEWIKVGGGSE